MSNAVDSTEILPGKNVATPERAAEEQEPLPQNDIADKIAATINARPPVIGELSRADTQGIEIKIPIGGDAWKELSQKTGIKTTHGMKEKLRGIALKENLNISFGTDDDGIGDTVKMIKKPGVRYEKFMDGEDLSFIGCFEFHTVRC